jgi:hypothetical protein
VAADELDRLMALVDLAVAEGDTPDMGLELGLRGVLLSPHFLYRPELDPDPTSETSHPLSDWEIASRLSYFLWSSIPDDALHDAAAAGELQTDEGLRAQVVRMLADPKADALVENFAGQWLLIRALDDHVPDYAAFPSYDDALREAFRSEMQLFFREFLLGNHGLDRMLDAGFTHLNDRLATHYGLPFSGGADFEPYDLSQVDERFGLLTLGGWLTVRSYPRRTSPVKRGVWILDHLLCDRPPDPPANVPALLEEEEAGGTLRERLEAHRADPVCNSCHRVMDPLGLGLENYDGIGAFRTEDNALPIDATGTYYPADGSEVEFDGARDMAALIQSDPRYFSCLAKKLLVYALGRGTSEHDDLYLDGYVAEMAASGYLMPELIQQIVLSQPFRTRRGVKEEP